MSYIEDLLAQIQDGTASKQAAEEKDEKREERDEKRDDKREEKDEKREGKREEKDEKDEKGEKKEASDLFAELAALHPDLQKRAAQEAEAMFLADLKRREFLGGAMPQKEASVEFTSEQERDLFNMGFEDQTMKLASVDPEYAQILYQQEVKEAFNAGFAQGAAEIKQAAFGGQA